jgi:hypothetical protein
MPRMTRTLTAWITAMAVALGAIGYAAGTLDAAHQTAAGSQPATVVNG